MWNNNHVVLKKRRLVMDTINLLILVAIMYLGLIVIPSIIEKNEKHTAQH